MERLAILIAEHSRWSPLTEYVRRIDGAKTSDFPLCIENAKSLLESIGKEICQQKGQRFESDESVGKLLKLAFGTLGYQDSDAVRQIGSAVATIAQSIGELRNEIGATVHGRTMEELEAYGKNLDQLSLDFLTEAVQSICCLLIQLFEGAVTPVRQEPEALNYDDNPEFNDYLDDSYGEFAISAYSYTASQVLYNCDPTSYGFELTQFKLPTSDNE